MTAGAGRADQLREALGANYRIEGELGSGGMATVYLANDLRHGRMVAVKVLRPDLAETVGVGRFLREIEIAARLTHPHILDLHDSGRVGDTLYYVMPYLPGGSLRGRLLDATVLQRPEAMKTTREVAEALAYAHRHGVIHRDVKPENILLSAGHAVVADFGIATALGGADAANLTRSGFPLGTPGYMSPEQAAGLTDLDARTDVYSLGCVVYEMLVGEPPGLWPTDDAVRLRRFVDARPEHRTRLDLLPGRWEQALVQALAMRRRDRFESPVDLADALETAAADRRRYDPTQVREIVARAADAQARAATVDGWFTPRTVEQIGEEVGIAPEAIRRAEDELRGDRPYAASSRRGFADDEVRAIIARAIELDEGPDTGAGLSVGAVEQAAADVGITPERVRDAIRAIDQPPARPRWLFGRPDALATERALPRSVAPDDWAAMEQVMREACGTRGRTAVEGDAYLWSASDDPASPGNMLLAVTTATGGPRLRLQHGLTDLGGEVSGAAAGWMAGGLLGVAVTVGLGAGATSAVPFFGIAAATAGAYGASRWFFAQEATRRQRALDALAERLISAPGKAPEPS